MRLFVRSTVLVAVALLCLSPTVLHAQQGGESADEAHEAAESEDSQGRRWALQELVNRARNNPNLVEEFKAKREQAEWKKFQAKWARGPKIQSTTTIAPVPDNADPDRLSENFEEIANLNIGPLIREDLAIIVPVYTFGRIGTLKKLADLGIDVTDLKKREARLNLIFQTKRAYYSLQLSRTFRELLQEGDKRIDQRVQDMQEARDFGTADFETEDLRKLQIFAAEVDERIADNRKLRSIATSGLKYLTKIDEESPQVGQLDETSDPAELEARTVYLEAAKRKRPELNQLEKAIRARQLQVRLEKQQFAPNIAVALGLGISWSTEQTARQPVCFREQEGGNCENIDGLFAKPDVDPLSRFSVGIGLTMRWKLDPLVQRGRLGERKAQLRTLRAQKRRAEGAIELEIKKKFEDAQNSLEKIEIRQRRLEAARRWRDQFGLSMETSGAEMEDLDKDAVEALKAYYEAKAKYLESRYNHYVARAALAQSIGVDYLSQVGADGTVRGTVPLEGESKTSGSEKEEVQNDEETE